MGSRIRPAAVLVVAVLAAALLGFAYLTQTLTSTATAVAIDELLADQQELVRLIKSRETLILAESSESVVQDRMADLGLIDLGRVHPIKSR